MSPDPKSEDRLDTRPAETRAIDQEFLSRPRAVALLAVLAVGFALCCLLVVLLPHDRYIRYQQFAKSDLFRSRYVYERIHYDKTPIDVAIIGTSRVEAAISPVILEQELSQKFGRPIHVANLAIPDEGRNLHFLLVRELLQYHPETRMILLSVSERADVTHPAFRYLGDAKDLVTAPFLLNHYYFLDVSFLPYRQMSLFGQSLLPNWFGLHRTLRSDYEGAAFDPTFSFYLPSGKLVNRNASTPTEKLTTGAARRNLSLGGTWHPDSAWHILNNPVEPVYTERLVEVAKQHCAEVIFVHLPYFQGPPDIYDQAYYRKLSPLLDASAFDRDPEVYGDLEHFNRRGTERIAPWLWSSMQPYLGPLENPACTTR
jgi:hypothetical protein